MDTKAGLASDLHIQILEVLLSCEPLRSDQALRNVFVDERLAAWRDQISQTDTSQQRAEAVISLLYAQSDRQGNNGLVSFLNVLAERLDENDARTERLVELAGRLQDYIAKGPEGDEPPPFKGLQYFEEEDAHLYFGREALTASLVAALSKERFLAVVGASGSGKSSVVRAGVLPALRRGEAEYQGQRSDSWHIHTITPGDEPLKELAATLTHDSESVTAMKTLISDMAADTEILDLWLYRHFAGQDTRLMLIVDQFEELFTQCDDEQQRQRFVENLVNAVQSGKEGRLSLILTLRADFYAQAVQFPALVRLLEQQQRIVEAMTAEQLRQAIEGPLAYGEWTAQPGLVDTILDDVGREPGALPLLSHALLETWRRREGRQLTLAGYQAAGSVRRAIATTAENVFAQLSVEQRGLARNIFLRLTELGEGQEDTRRRAGLNELMPTTGHGEAILLVLQKLADARLVTTGEDSAEVAHEALIREWPRLRRWLDENRDALRAHRQLMDAAAEWEKNKRDASYLYRGAQLEAAREQLTGDAIQLNEVEQAFLTASGQQHADDLAAARAQAEREAIAARQLRRRALFLAVALVIAGGLAVISFVFAGRATDSAVAAQTAEANAVSNAEIARTAEADALAANATSVFNVELQETRAAEAEASQAAAEAAQAAAEAEKLEAERQSAIALSRQLASQSAGELEKENLELSLLLAIEAGRAATTNEALQALRQVLPGIVPHQTLLDPAGEPAGVSEAWLSHDGERVVTLRGNGLRVYDTTTGAELATLSGHTQLVSHVAWKSDDSQILSSGADGTARVWDVATGAELFRLGHDDWVWEAMWNEDEDLILTRSDDDTAGVWDAETGDPVLFLEGREDDVEDAAWSHDERFIVTSSESEQVRVWDAATGNEEYTLVHAGEGSFYRVLEARWSADDSRIFTRASDESLKVWDVETEAELLSWSLNPDQPEGWRTTVTWNKAGSQLMAGNSLGRVTVWNIETGAVELSLEGHQDVVTQAAWNADESLIVTTGDDGIVLVWDADSGNLIARYGEPDRPAVQALWAPAGDRLVITQCSSDFSSSSRTCDAYVWDVTTNELLIMLPDVEYGVVIAFWSPSWSADGRLLLTRREEADETVLWDMTAVTELPVLTGHTGVITSVAWHPDSNLLLAAGADGAARVWDADTGEVRHLLAGHRDPVWQASWRADGQQILTAGEDGTARVWDAASGEELRQLEMPDGTGVRQAVWSPDGEKIATVSEAAISLWNAASGQLEHTLLTRQPDFSGEEYPRQVIVILWSSDGKRILTALGGTFPADYDVIQVWDADSGEELSQFSIQARYDTLIDAAWGAGEDRVWILNTVGEFSQFDPAYAGIAYYGDFLNSFGATHALFNNDQSTILTSDPAGVAHIWDAFTGIEQVSLTGHTDSILAMQWSPDEAYVLTAGEDGTARIWETVTGQELVTFGGHPAAVTQALWNHDGSRILTVTADGDMRQYFTAADDLMAAACRRVTRNLSLEEWQRARGQTPYARTCPELPYHASVNSNHYIALGEALAREGDLPGAIALFEQALALNTGLDFEPELRAQQAAIFPLLERGASLAQQGLIDDALAAYAAAEDYFGDPEIIDADYWHELCRWGSLYERAAAVAFACEQALAQSQRVIYFESRGINRALQGDFAGAIVDFETFIEDAFESEREPVEGWLERLRQGENPFDAATLDALREE